MSKRRITQKKLAKGKSVTALKFENVKDFSDLATRRGLTLETGPTGLLIARDSSRNVGGYFETAQDNALFNDNGHIWGSFKEMRDWEIVDGYDPPDIHFDYARDGVSGMVDLLVVWEPMTRKFSLSYAGDDGMTMFVGNFDEQETKYYLLTNGAVFCNKSDSFMNNMTADLRHLDYDALVDIMRDYANTIFKFRMLPRDYIPTQPMSGMALPLGTALTDPLTSPAGAFEAVGPNSVPKIVIDNSRTTESVNIALCLNESEYVPLSLSLSRGDDAILAEVKLLIRSLSTVALDENILSDILAEEGVHTISFLTVDPTKTIVNASPATENIKGDQGMLVTEHRATFASSDLAALSRAQTRVGNYAEYSGWEVGQIKESDKGYSFDVKASADKADFQDDSKLSGLAGDSVTMTRSTPKNEDSDAKKAKFAIAQGQDTNSVLDQLIGTPPAANTETQTEAKKTEFNSGLVLEDHASTNTSSGGFVLSYKDKKFEMSIGMARDFVRYCNTNGIK